MLAPAAEMEEQVAIYAITQATTAIFADLYLRLTFLFFIEEGSKRVQTSGQEITAEAGDLLIFPPGAQVNMVNLAVRDRAYRATGISFSDALISAVFAPQPSSNAVGIQVVRAAEHGPSQVLPLIRDTLVREDLPSAIQRHRLLEPLLWLQAQGITLPTARKDDFLARLRQLLDTDLAHDWRADPVAQALAVSPSTMRRTLARRGQSFAKVLSHARLERGLTLLQTTREPISGIALDCGFKTPSHFSDAFRKRFGISPRDIRIATN